MRKVYSPGDITSAGLCIGCGVCASGREDVSMKFDAYGFLKPSGPSEWFKKASPGFSNICPFSPVALNEDRLAGNLFPYARQSDSRIGKYLSCLIGHVSEGSYRANGSSGGMVTWIATELMRRGLIDGVVHIVTSEDPQNDRKFFEYRISKTQDGIRKGAKSRYYPVELSSVLDEIRMRQGYYAVVAVPCMIKAIQLLRYHDPVLRERIRFTLGLFCGHMKSAFFAESIAMQMKVQLKKVRQIDYRHKLPDRPANWYNARLILTDGSSVSKDWWKLKDGDWGAGFFMNNACNYCDDIVAETADISFGDAWIEPYFSDGMGTNVIVVRSHEIQRIIDAGMGERRIALTPVVADVVAKTQAAGFRQRREGLSYRLTWIHNGIRPLKRVSPDSSKITSQRKRIYRFRYHISKWSHRIFRISRIMRWPFIYLFWARIVISVYHGIAYHNGNTSEMLKRFSGLRR